MGGISCRSTSEERKLNPIIINKKIGPPKTATVTLTQYIKKELVSAFQMLPTIRFNENASSFQEIIKISDLIDKALKWMIVVIISSVCSDSHTKMVIKYDGSANKCIIRT